MNSFVIVCLIILIYLLYIIIEKSDSEFFDTYRNHNEFANSYYKNNNPKIFKGDLNSEKTDLYAQYMWNDVDKNGMKLYDHYYEDLNNCNYANVNGLYEYEKGVRDDPYTYVYGQKISLNQGKY